jgi:cytidine deaminase
MKNITITTNYLFSIRLLNCQMTTTNGKGRRQKKTYAPYSKFKVGTAILLDNGEIILGSNQENAASPRTMRGVAIFCGIDVSRCQNSTNGNYCCI